MLGSSPARENRVGLGSRVSLHVSFMFAKLVVK